MAWCSLIAALLAYETQAPRHELLSYALKRYSRKYPWLIRIGIIATALHLLEWLPLWLDPWVWAYLIRLAVEKLIAKIREAPETFNNLVSLFTVLTEAAA